MRLSASAAKTDAVVDDATPPWQREPGAFAATAAPSFGGATASERPAPKPSSAPPTPRAYQAPPPASSFSPEVGAVDRQIAEQGMTRKIWSEQVLREIRAHMQKLKPYEAPMFNPLQTYPSRGTATGENAARKNTIDRIMGYQPNNKVTAREIIEDIDAQMPSNPKRLQ
jgi:hypothetical protein